MKLNYLQLKAHLSKTLSPIYIVSGDELWLKQEAITSIREKAALADYKERSRLQIETGCNPDELYTLLYSASLLAEKSLVELDIRASLPTKSISQILQNYATQPSPHHLLLIDANKLDAKITASSWYKAIEKVGTVITIWPIPRPQLPKWIIAQAKQYQLTLQQDAVNLLADYAEGNLTAAAQAIEKLSLLGINTAIDARLIKTIFMSESRYTIFDLVENVIAGHSARSLAILETLKEEGTEPVLILWALARELRLLSTFANELKQGATYDTLFAKHRIFPNRQQSVRHFLNAFTPKDCGRALMHAADLDKIIKGVLSGNAWENLQLFCLRFASI